MCDNGTAATAYCLCSPALPCDAPARRAGLSSHLVLSSMCDDDTAAALLPLQRHTAASAAVRRLTTPQPEELASARTSC